MHRAILWGVARSLAGLLVTVAPYPAVGLAQPAPSGQETPGPEAAPAPPEPRPSRLPEQLKGDSGKKLYYPPGCLGSERLNPASVVQFTSEKEALQAGYRKAPECQ